MCHTDYVHAVPSPRRSQGRSAPIPAQAVILKQVRHRGWAYFQARLAFTVAALNVLVQWHGFQPTASGFVPLSMAAFSL